MEMTMGYNDDFSMPPDEVERVLREVRSRYAARRRREILGTALATVAALGAMVALVWFWRMS